MFLKGVVTVRVNRNVFIDEWIYLRFVSQQPEEACGQINETMIGRLASTNILKLSDRFIMAHCTIFKCFEMFL